MASISLPELGKWRKRLLPVYADEMKQFIAMSIILFCILFNYTIVRTLKDTLLINAPHVDTKMVVSMAKLFVVTPGTILFVILYVKMSNVLTKERLFYTTLIPFVAFFFVYAFFLYPVHQSFHASPETVAMWSEGFLGRISPLIGYWSFTLFYLMAELFGNVAVGILFWQFANQVIPTEKAKRLYPIYGLWSNLGLISAGLLGKFAGVKDPEAGASAAGAVTDASFVTTIQFLCGFVTAAGLIIIASYYWINRRCLDGTANASSGGSKKKKPKLSIGESLKFLMQSKYLGYITILVLAYGITMNLVEVSWKDSVKAHFGSNKFDYNSFMSNLYIYTGVSTMVLIIFSQNLISIFGWRIAASITPMVSLITGGLFFAFLIFKDMSFMSSVCDMLGATAPALAMWIGLAQNVSTKSAKYSLFDPTKEMAYIPLDEESKIKGKAAIDVIGGRAGKSGGGVINMAIGKFFDGHTFTMMIGLVTGFICLTWWWAVQKLSGEYEAKLATPPNKNQG
ncbi:MAG: NTP/NDP exchange transporter [Alphaproteobacteria bacterium]|nr:NTP/NDP exchange transporter [Alphaproteobacteria bacterium]